MDKIKKIFDEIEQCSEKARAFDRESNDLKGKLSFESEGENYTFSAQIQTNSAVICSGRLESVEQITSFISWLKEMYAIEGDE